MFGKVFTEALVDQSQGLFVSPSGLFNLCKSFFGLFHFLFSLIKKGNLLLSNIFPSFNSSLFLKPLNG